MLRRLVLLCGVVTLLGCKNEPQKAAVPEPRPFDHAVITEIVPTVDGGAYAVSDNGDVWFLRGPEATRVKEVPSLSQVPTAALSTKTESWLWARLAQERHRRHADQRATDDAEQSDSQ